MSAPQQQLDEVTLGLPERRQLTLGLVVGRLAELRVEPPDQPRPGWREWVALDDVSKRRRDLQRMQPAEH
jgi:hypothetical protein